MTRIVFDVTAEADPFGPALHRLTQAKRKFFRLDWRGSGSGGLTMNLSRSEATYLRKNRGIRVWDLDLSESIPIGWWVLTKRSSKILTKDGKGGREVTWTGPGLLGVLGRARLDAESHVDQGPLEGDGTWRWHLQGAPHGGAKLGAMYNRAVDECIHPSRPRQPLAFVEKDFDGFEDSNGDAWTGYEGELFDTIGTPLSEVTNHFMDLGLDVEARENLVDKKLLLSAYRSPQGTDRTGSAWASDVVRFQRQTDGTLATTNIKDELVSTGDAELEVSDLLVGSSDGFSWVDNPAAGVDREGFLGSDGSTDAARDSAGEANIAARGRASDTIKLNVRHGNDPANGLYRFGPRWISGVHAAPGDLTTLHTGTGEGDYNESDQVIASITWTDRAEGPGQDIHVEFGASYRSSAEREFRARLTQLVSWKSHTHPPNPRLCKHSQVVETSTAWKATATATPPSGWHDAGFDDSAYGNAVETDGLESSTDGWYGHPSDRWIWATTGAESDACLRTEFTLTSIPSAAILQAAADGSADVYINGTLVGSATDWATLTGVRVDPSVFVVGANCISIIGLDVDALGQVDGAYAVLTINPARGTSNEVSRCGHGHIIEDLVTAETDPAKSLRPDGDGGVQWVAMAEGLVPWVILTNYGAAGDGTTVDTTAIDDWLDAVNSAGDGAVAYAPSGKYLTAGGHAAITVNCRFLGDNPNAFEEVTGGTIFACSSPTANLFTITAESASVEKVGFLNVAGATPTDGAAVVVTSAEPRQRVDFERCHFRGFYRNTDVQSGTGWTMDRCHWQGSVLQDLRIRNINNDDVGDWTLVGCSFTCRTYAGGSAIRLESSGGGKIIGCKINRYVVEYEFGLDAALGTTTSGVLIISSNSFENTSDDAIHITSNGGSYEHMLIVGNQFGLYGSDTGYAVSIVAASAGELAHITIGPNAYHTGGTPRAAVELVNVDDVTLIPGSLSGFDDLYDATTSTNVVVLGAGATAHSALTGLLADDHTHYLNEARHSAIDHGGGIGPILVSSGPAGSPLVFGDLLQNSEGTDLLYASEP